MAYDDSTIAVVFDSSGGQVGSVRGNWAIFRGGSMIGRVRKTGPGHAVIEMAGGSAVGHVEHFEIYLGDRHVGYLDGDTGSVYAGDSGHHNDHEYVGSVEMKVSILHRAGAAGILLLRGEGGSLRYPGLSRPIRRL